MLKEKDLIALAPYLSDGTVVHMEVQDFGNKGREVMLEYGDGRKVSGNLDANPVRLKPVGISSISEHFARGKYGNPNWRGNCSGLLIKELLEHFRPDTFGDLAVGSGTAIDVAADLGYGSDRTVFNDLNPAYGGVDISDPDIDFPLLDFIFFHPPYYVFPGSSMPVYSGKGADGRGMWGKEINPHDGSRIKDPWAFKKWFYQCNANLYRLLHKGGRLAILMGDSRFRGKYYSMFKEMDVFGEMEQVIVKKQYNCVSNSTSYPGKFIPLVHEYLVVIRKGSPYIVPVTTVRHVQCDLRTSKNSTWASVMAMILEDHGGRLSRRQLSEEMQRTEKANANNHVDAKMRQEIQRHPRMFRCDGEDVLLARPAKEEASMAA